MRTLRLLPLLLALPLAACDDTPADPAKGEAQALEIPPGKADATDNVTDRGALGFDDPYAGAFEADLQFDGFRLTVGDGAVVDLEVTQRGSSRGLDTTLYVFGPWTQAEGFGKRSIAFDDDAGWGLLSRLRGLTLSQGEYLVVVGSYTARARGDYRLLATCAGGDCAAPAPAASCHPALLDAIDACVAETTEDWEWDPEETPLAEVVATCADVEPLAATRDRVCASDDPAFCALDMQAFALEYLPKCSREGLDRTYDRACIFGRTYRDLAVGADPLVIQWARTLTASDVISDVEAAQIVEAVRTTAYDDVTTVAEAFDRVDEGLVHQTQVWDTSARRGYTVYEVGAGDNSFGMYFREGTLEPVAQINDSDLYECSETWGPERRPCAADEHCADGLRCQGRTQGGQGLCLDPQARTEGDGAACLADTDCKSGLVCAGNGFGGEGICNPAWMRRSFVAEPYRSIPDGRGTLSYPIMAYGLASVSTDVVLDLWISHPRPADLKVVLRNPDGTEAVVIEAAQSADDLYLEAQPIQGFPGDESVNGQWTLEITDTVRGQAGRLSEVGLTLTSRWD